MLVPETSKYNLLTDHRWIAFLPTQAINPNYGSTSLSFNLVDFVLEPLTLAMNKIAVHGYEIPSPASVRNGTKEISFTYLPDSALSQYKFLYQWYSLIAVEDGSGLAETVKSNQGINSIFADIGIILLTEFKNPVIEITYHDAVLTKIGGINFSYQNNAAPIRHTFTVEYTKISFNMEPTF